MGAAAPGAGHRIYSHAFLHVYDPLVLGIYSSWVWRCPASRLVAHYQRHLRRRHLDVGPGTGYFLGRARLPQGAEVTLLDPNQHVLEFAARRLRALRPETVQGDVRDAELGHRRFDSAALNHVLHCLPGPPHAKATAVRTVASSLVDDGVLFGATILGESRVHTPVSRAALHGLNRQGVFDNRDDTEEGLRAMLAASFATVDVDVVGSVAVFSARAPRR